jgi:hypothetical protein
LATILDLVQPKLIECGLTIIQIPSGKYGLITMLTHKSGEYIGSRYTLEPRLEVIDSKTQEKGITPQSVGSSITYQRRYAIGAILNLNIDVDDDAEAPKEPEAPKPSAKELLAKSLIAAATAEVTSTTKETSTTTKLMNEGDGVTKQSDNEPCNDALAQKIKNALGSWEQQKKGVTADFKAKLLASGRKKITDFTTTEANQLLASIEAKSIASFFDNQLNIAS